ncbi:MAG: ATPase, partial [Gammaproteobacteria bacterium]|nr:ATPase [Gammaproteobacteria bacterium]
KFEHQNEIRLGALQACVGPAAGIELNAFISNLDQLPDISAILKGEMVKAPTEIDLQYAVASSLVGHAIRVIGSDDAQTIHGHILNYASAFPQREMGVMLVSDMFRAVGNDIFSVPEFSQWSKAIADVMLY